MCVCMYMHVCMYIHYIQLTQHIVDGDVTLYSIHFIAYCTTIHISHICSYNIQYGKVPSNLVQIIYYHSRAGITDNISTVS